MNRIVCAILLLVAASPTPGLGKSSSAHPAPTPDSLNLVAIAPPPIPATRQERAAAIAAIEARVEALLPSHRMPLLKRALTIAEADGPSPTTLDLRVRIIAAMGVAPDPDRGADFTPTEQAVIDAARSALEDHRSLDWSPDPVTARAITRLARVLIDVGDFADAEIVLTRAVAMHRALAQGAPSADYGAALAMMAEFRGGKFGRKVGEVEPWLLAAITQYRGLPQPDLATAHGLEAELAALYGEDPKREADARAQYGTLLADARSGGSVRERIEALSGLARFETRAKKPDAAIPLLDEALALASPADRDLWPYAVKLHLELADVYADLARPKDEKEHLTALIALLRSEQGDGSDWTRYGSRLVAVDQELEEDGAAVELAREILAALPAEKPGETLLLRLIVTEKLAASLLNLDDYDAVLAATASLTEIDDIGGQARRLNFIQLLLNRAEALRELRRFDEAEVLYDQALSVPHDDLRTWGIDDDVIYKIAGLNQLKAGHDAKARAAFDKAEKASAAVAGPRSLSHAKLLIRIAQDLNEFPRQTDAFNNPADAEKLFRRSIAIMDKLPDWPEADYLSALDGLADARGNQGAWVDAIKVHESRIKLVSAKHGKASREALRAQNEYASFLENTENFKAALDVQRSMFDTALAAFGPEHEVTIAIGMNSMSVSIDDTRILAHGRYVFDALFGGRKNAENPSIDLARMEMAQIEAKIGDVDTAMALIKAIDVDNVYGVGVGAGMQFDFMDMLLAQVDARKGEYGRHQGYIRTIVQKCEATGLRDPDCPGWLADYGQDLYRTGDIAGALPYVEGGYELAEREQLDLARRSVQSRRTASDRHAAAQLDRYGVFADTLWEAGAGAADDNTIDLRIFQAAQRITNSEAAGAMAVAQTRLASGTSELAGLIQQLQTIADMLNAEEGDAIQAKLSEVLTLVGDGKGAADRDGRESVDIEEKKKGARPKRSAEDIARLRQKYRTLDAKIRLLYPEYAALLSPAPVALDDVQKALGPREALLVAAQGETHLHMLLVTHDRSAWERSTVDLTEIDRLVSELLCHVDLDKCPEPLIKTLFGSRAGADFTPFDVAAAHALYEQSVGLLARDLDGIDTLYVVAEGQMAQLPLGMLAAKASEGEGADPEWLIDRFAFIRLPSVSALLLPGKDGNPPWAREFEGYGDPLLDGPRRQEPPVYSGTRGTDGLQLADVRFLKQLAPLKGSRRELLDMAEVFPSGAAAIHLGAKATEAEVKGNAGLDGSRIISFATHGLLPAQVAGIDEPGLVLTPPTKPSLLDDGLLTASEVAQLRLSADMVILSACNTASAEHDRAGDSMSSLSRAFLFAGAGSLLASHWRVSDDATVALMTEMLRLRRADPGLTRAKALQQAMRTVRTGVRADGSAIAGWQDYWAHPAAWAAFSLIANRNQ